jgi:hypothetical protein
MRRLLRPAMRAAPLRLLQGWTPGRAKLQAGIVRAVQAAGGGDRPALPALRRVSEVGGMLSSFCSVGDDVTLCAFIRQVGDWGHLVMKRLPPPGLTSEHLQLCEQGGWTTMDFNLCSAPRRAQVQSGTARSCLRISP